MSEQRTHRLQSISQVTGKYNDDAIVLDDFGALIVDAELEESMVDVDDLLGLQVGGAIRFGGGASPLMELTRLD